MNYTCKLPVSGSENICILNTEWLEQEVNLLLLHDNKAWTGKFQISSNGEIAELLEQLSMTAEDYLQEAKTALTTHGGADNFAYSIESEKFTWKKYVRKNMAIKFGYIAVSPLPVFDTFEKIIDNILQSHIKTSDKLNNIRKENQVLEKENINLKTKLDHLMNEKSEMETMLYSKFLCLLNEKKKMIENLKQKIEPSNLHTNNSDSQNSDSDHFGSETEIDSEEEQHTPTKVDIVKGNGTPKIVDRGDFILPKRSKQSIKHEIRAGPSGINRLTKQKSSKDLVCSVNESSSSGLRRSKRNGCSEIIINEHKGNDSLDEAFMFPKRSKSANISKKNPTVSNICYDSDDNTDEEETIMKSEPESKGISSHKNITEKILTPKTKQNGVSEEVKKENEKEEMTKPSMKSELKEKHGTPKEFSRSTLNMLNNLI